jgi:molybdenum cofactor cytidylyltransferase
MIPCVILAAGASRRMGRPKALLPVGEGGDLFVTHLAGTLVRAGADDVVVVVGAHAREIEAAVASATILVRVVENPHWERGQLSSLVVALDVVDRPGVQAVLVIPVDMPLVSDATVRAVLDAYRRRGRLVVRPALGDRHGHPVIFDRALFDELRAADPSAGARAVISAHRDRVLDVPVGDLGAFTDIDTPEDYQRCLDLMSKGRR